MPAKLTAEQNAEIVTSFKKHGTLNAVQAETGRAKASIRLVYTGTPITIELGKLIYKNKKSNFLQRKFTTYSDVVKARELLEPPAKHRGHNAASNRKRDGSKTR